MDLELGMVGVQSLLVCAWGHSSDVLRMGSSLEPRDYKVTRLAGAGLMQVARCRLVRV